MNAITANDPNTATATKTCATISQNALERERESRAYHPTKTLLEVASVIAGADVYMGNQSSGLAVAIGLGVPFCCELRRDLPRERNECYFPNQPNGQYF